MGIYSYQRETILLQYRSKTKKYLPHPQIFYASTEKWHLLSDIGGILQTTFS